MTYSTDNPQYPTLEHSTWGNPQYVHPNDNDWYRHRKECIALQRKTMSAHEIAKLWDMQLGNLRALFFRIDFPTKEEQRAEMARRRERSKIDISARNNAVYEKRLAGATYRELSEEYGRSRARLKQIVDKLTRQKRKALERQEQTSD